MLTKISVLFNLKGVLISQLITYSTTNPASTEECGALPVPVSLLLAC